MNRYLGITLTFLFALTLMVSTPQVTSACPMCKAAAEQDENQPKAYMYSILFMLAMPAVIFGSFGYGLYRMNQRENEFAPLNEQIQPMSDETSEIE